MEPISLAFASVSMVDICIRVGKDLYARCQAYNRAEREIRESNLLIQGHWIKIENQLSALQAVWDALPVDYQLHQGRVLEVLQSRLLGAVQSLNNLNTRTEEEGATNGVIDGKRLRELASLSKLKRFKYAAYAKSSLEGIIKDLDRWQRDFDPSWFFLSRMAVPVIDKKLSGNRASKSKGISTVLQLRQIHHIGNSTGPEGSGPVFLESGYEVQARESIPFSSASTGRHTPEGLLIIDHIPIKDSSNPGDVERKTKDVRDLARVLSAVDSERFNLLPCRGVSKIFDGKPTGFDLIFSLPSALQQAQPISLRYILSDQSVQYPMNERVALAASLARSIVFLHSSSFVHKSVSPENIILCQPLPETLGTPFLVEFDQFRHSEARTHKIGDLSWEKNLYRHPGRQGLHPQDEYMMQHDIYGVGVCLLEIGLWTSFVMFDSGKTAPAPLLPINNLIKARDQRLAATQIKQLLVDLAKSKLPILMRKIYAEVVVSCLTCLDRNNEHFGDEWELHDEDGIQVGVRYIEKILFEIERIVI